jgi:hypothetical protein
MRDAVEYVLSVTLPPTRKSGRRRGDTQEDTKERHAFHVERVPYSDLLRAFTVHHREPMPEGSYNASNSFPGHRVPVYRLGRRLFRPLTPNEEMEFVAGPGEYVKRHSFWTRMHEIDYRDSVSPNLLPPSSDQVQHMMAQEESPMERVKRQVRSFCGRVIQVDGLNRVNGGRFMVECGEPSLRSIRDAPDSWRESCNIEDSASARNWHFASYLMLSRLADMIVYEGGDEQINSINECNVRLGYLPIEGRTPNASGSFIIVHDKASLREDLSFGFSHEIRQHQYFCLQSLSNLNFYRLPDAAIDHLLSWRDGIPLACSLSFFRNDVASAQNALQEYLTHHRHAEFRAGDYGFSLERSLATMLKNLQLSQEAGRCWLPEAVQENSWLHPSAREVYSTQPNADMLDYISGEEVLAIEAEAKRGDLRIFKSYASIAPEGRDRPLASFCLLSRDGGVRMIGAPGVAFLKEGCSFPSDVEPRP